MVGGITEKEVGGKLRLLAHGTAQQLTQTEPGCLPDGVEARDFDGGKSTRAQPDRRVGKSAIRQGAVSDKVRGSAAQFGDGPFAAARFADARDPISRHDLDYRPQEIGAMAT